MTVYQGGCHCGAVRFRVDVQDKKVVDCNIDLSRFQVRTFDGQHWEESVDALR